tara:strand:- start:2370 stop:3122 length:753 start_codon:yes stop_codon:yes gene_type:complete
MASKKINKKLFGLVGRNIDYSFSKGYFNEKFRQEQLTNCSYENFDLNSIELLSSVLSHENISGLNVTTPYKREVIRFLDQLSEPSKKMQAVNTIRFEKNGKTTGHNTDVYGFEKSLKKLKSRLPKKALILGSGGASSAVAFVLDKLKINYQYVSRNPKNDQISYQDVNTNLLESHKLIINASPIGTFPKVNLSPKLPYQEINETHILFDLIYNPLETLFLKEGKRRGAIVSNGLKMLEYQAEKSWEIWNK